jgi:hypothetical protein
MDDSMTCNDLCFLKTKKKNDLDIEEQIFVNDCDC